MSAPRYSIIPGDFAEDSRADVGHFRVLNVLGRHTDKGGWCRLKQLRIGEAAGLSRETVNRKMSDLVEWGYVEKHAADATGRAIWYRVLMDRQRPPEIDDEDAPTGLDDPVCETSSGPVSGASHVEYNSGSELHPTCEEQITPGVTARITPGVTPAITHNDLSLTTKKDSPPLPPRKRGARGCDVDQWLEALSAPERAVAIDELIAPLVRQRRFEAPDPVFALRQLADWASAQDRMVLKAALFDLLDRRKAVVKASDIEEAVKRACDDDRKRKVGRVPGPVAGSVLVERWPAVLAALRLDAEVVRAWFDGRVVPVDVVDGRATLTAVPFVRRHVSQNYEPQILAAVSAAVEPVRSITWVDFKPLSETAGRAA